MTHLELREKLLKAFGGQVPMSARDRWAQFLKSEATEIYVRYDWIKDHRFFKWIYDSPEVDFGEGTEGVTVWVAQFGRIGHE